MSSIDQLKWSYLTGMVNEMKSPNKFLQTLLYPVHQTLPTEDVELSFVLKDREAAPFVRKNGEAILVSGHSEKFATVAAPNIRIKRPFTPSDLFTRRPGTPIFVGSQQQVLDALRAHIARDMQVMSDMVVNATELLCAMSLRGVIQYSVSDQEVFQITYPKPNANNMTPETDWDDATPANVNLEEDFRQVKKRFNDEVGLGVTDCIMGGDAAANFLNVIRVQYKTNTGVNWNPGNVALQEQYNDDGVLYLGRFCGIDCWEYARQVNVNGVATDLIRPKYAEFISRSPSSQRVLYYGAIADLDAMDGNKMQTERFSKSWKIPDPSAMMALLHSRPLPVPRRAGAMVSMEALD